jgi:competence protein ComEC
MAGDERTIRRDLGLVAHRPAVAVAGLFVLGVGLHRVLPHRLDVWIICGALLVLGAGIMLRHGLISSICLGGAIFSAGVAAAQLEAFYYPRDHISAFATDTMRLAQLELSIEDPPRLLTGVYGQTRPLPPKQALTASVQRILAWNGWVEARGDMLVQIAQPHPRLAAGQRVRVLGMLERPGPAMNPGQFDWAGYYREQRILVSLQVSQAGNIHIIDEHSPGWIAGLRAKSRRLLAMGFDPDRSLDHALLRALVLGDRDPELRDVQEQFRRTGTSHHLAISGMHVAVLGGVVYGVCRLLRIGPRTAAIVGMVFVAVYGLCAQPSPPVIRSVLLCLAFGIGLTIGRSVDALQLLALSVLAMLIVHPLDLFNAGFQLSFGTVLGLILLTHLLMQKMATQADRDRLIAMSVQPPDAMTSAAMWADHKLLQILAAGLVAWMVSFPLIAMHFEQLNPWAVFSSILIAPIVFLALVGGMMKILLTLLWPAGAETWAALAGAPVAWMRRSVDLLARLPGSEVPLPAPPLWLVALFYLLLLLSLRSRGAPGIRWTLGFATVGTALLILALPYHRRAPVTLAGDELRMTLLAVGGGQCAVIEPPSGRVVLVDAGSASLSDLLRKCLAPFLRHRGRTEIDTLIISHANYDHFSAAAEVVAAYDVREVLTGSRFRSHSIDNPPAESLLRSLDSLDRPPRELAPGDRIPLGRDTFIDVLWPPAAARLSANDSSLVFRLTHAGRSILFTGDVQTDGLTGLMKDSPSIQADVLIAPHHGSSEDQTPAFVKAVAPAFILSSNDRSLTGKQRNFERMIGLAQLYRTNRCGAVTVHIDRAGTLSVEPFLANP